MSLQLSLLMDLFLLSSGAKRTDFIISREVPVNEVAAAGGVAASILSFTSFTRTSLGMIKSVRFAPLDNKNKSINRDNCNDINKENQQQQLTLVPRKSAMRCP